jgi:limonene-1,2-epoxide hydrolase
MRARAAVLLALAAALAAPAAAAAAAKPEQVVRAWSRALNADDNDAAASLFARNAEVVQGQVGFRLATHALAVIWNDGLPCSGTIVSLRVDGARVVATFLLGERPGHQCDAPGAKATAVFEIRDGKIVRWEQIPNPAPQPAKPRPKHRPPPVE